MLVPFSLLYVNTAIKHHYLHFPVLIMLAKSVQCFLFHFALLVSGIKWLIKPDLCLNMAIKWRHLHLVLILVKNSVCFQQNRIQVTCFQSINQSPEGEPPQWVIVFYYWNALCSCILDYLYCTETFVHVCKVNRCFIVEKI